MSKKKILKKVIEIGKYYKNYDLHMTKNHIEVKFTPKSNRENEVVFVSSLGYLDDDDFWKFQYNLSEHLYKLENNKL